MDLKQYSSEYLSLMETVYNNKHILNISTITYLCVLNVDFIDLRQFILCFDNHQNCSNVHMKRCIDKNVLEVSKRGKVKKSFYNQITLNFKDINKKSVKIFSNGKIQITGLTSLYECKHVSEFVLSLLKTILTGHDETRIEHSYIGMLNSNFSVMYNVDLNKLNKILQRDPRCFSVYNPESYPAINLKIKTEDRNLSVFIFGTGNIVITGSKTISEMKHAYCYITEMLSKFDVAKSTPYKPKPKRVEPYLDGYNIRQYLSCVV